MTLNEQPQPEQQPKSQREQRGPGQPQNPWAEYLSSFAEDRNYLNYASYGPPSIDVAETTARLTSAALSGEPSTTAALYAEPLRARAAFSRLSGFALEAVTLVPHTSLGLFQVAFGMSTGTVLVGAGEFPANLYPWWRADSVGGPRPRLMHSPDGRVTPDLVARSLTTDVTAVAVSAVDFRTGYRTDLGAIRDIIGPDRLLIVDGIQAFGVTSAEWTAADALVVGGQKWLRAGWGCAAMALSDRGLSRIQPVLGGWAGVDAAADYDGTEHEPLPGASRFSLTNLSPVTGGVFASALELVEKATVERIEEHIAGSVDLLHALLDEAGVPVRSPHARRNRAGIVVAGIPDGRAAEAHERLTAAGVSATVHGDDRIRLSVHATTTPGALEAATDVLRHFAPAPAHRA